MAKEENEIDESMDSMDEMVQEEKKPEVHHEKHAHHAHHKHAHVAHKDHSESGSSGNPWMIASIILFVAALLFMVLWLTKGTEQVKEVSEEQIKVDMKKFIDANLLDAGMSSTVESVTEKNGVYEVIVAVQGYSKITSYASKDGQIFFPSGLFVAEGAETPATNNQAQQPQPADVPKTDKPVVEVFVMSHCPYGTQIEKGILPVVDLLGDKADIQVKFVNYAMHGQKEIDEQLNQYCIQQEYSDKYYKYLQCFLADGDTARCVEELEFDQAKLDACISATDEEFSISADYADKTTWRGSFPSFSLHNEENIKYGVQGSPTLVVNGKVVSAARDSQSLKTVICGAFNSAPEECSTALSTAGPSPGFGFGTSGTDAAAAGCGV